MNYEIPKTTYQLGKDCHPAWYEAAWYELRKRRTTVTAFAKEIGMNRRYVNDVINGKVVSPLAEKRILEALGINAS